jgi:VCBS repeat-containing protein
VIQGLGADTDLDNTSGVVFEDDLDIIDYTQPTYGTVVFNEETGSFTYTPDETLMRANPTLEDDTFTYTLSDGFGGTDTATVTVGLTNQAPDAVSDSYTNSHNLVLDKDEAAGVIQGLGADTDLDNTSGVVFQDDLDVDSFTQPSYGTVSFNSETGAFTYTPDETAMRANPTLEDDTFTYTLSDGFGGTDTATVTVGLTNQNPMAQNDSYTNSHNLVLDVADIASGTIEGLLPGTEDYDPDNSTSAVFTDTLTVTPIVGGTTDQGGTVTVNPDGTFTYTPSETNYDMVPDSFEYTLLDGFGGTDTATVMINLTNQLPVAVTDTTIIAPGGSISISVLSNDFDLDGDQINFIDYTDPSNGSLVQIGDGVFIYTPNLGFVGTDSFTYFINSAGIEDPVEGSVTINVFRETPSIPGLIPPEVQFAQLQQAESAALADLLWMAKELGLCQGDLESVEEQNRCQEITQAYLAGAFLQATDLHPYRAATQLRNLAELLYDPDGYRTSALTRVVAEFVQPNVPPSPEQFASIAQAFEQHTDDGTHYATAGQWLDALAKYTLILNSEVGWQLDESVEFVMGKYSTPITEAGNISVIAFIQLYLEGVSG